MLDIKQSNYDLCDNDIDKTHSSKAIEYMLNSVRKFSIAKETDNIFRSYSSSNTINASTTPTQNHIPSKDIDFLKQACKLPAVKSNFKRPYGESFKSPSEIKGLNSPINNYDSSSRSRHHTQPRSQSKPFGMTNDHGLPKNVAKGGPFIGSLKPRLKSSNKQGNIFVNSKHSDQFRQLLFLQRLPRRESPDQNYASILSGSNANHLQGRRLQQHSTLTSVLPISQPGARDVADGRPRIHLQGHTIKPEKHNRLSSLVQLENQSIK